MEEAFQGKATVRAKTKRDKAAACGFCKCPEPQGSAQGGSHMAGHRTRVTPQELGNHRWQSKINFFFITSCKTDPAYSVFLVQ